MSWRMRLTAAFAGIAIAAFVLLVLLITELVVLGTVLNSNIPATTGTVTWDPVSLWHSGLVCKASITLAILIPVIISAVVGKYVHARLLHPH